MSTSIQVPRDHYFNLRYNHKARWLTYYYQLRLCDTYQVSNVCEIGPGHGWMKMVAHDLGIKVTTVDLDPALKPDVVAPINALPFPDESFEAACAFEVLEHMPFESFEENVRALARIAKKYVFLSLPDHRRILFHLTGKVPLLPYFDVFLKIPSGKKHVFDGQHYWEVGKRGYTLAKVRRACESAGLRVVDTFVPSDTPSNVFVVCAKKP